MADAGRHPNIKILTNTDIAAVEGEAGNFKVTVTMRPRYVNADLCVGCRNCANYCAYNVPNPFDENLSQAKAIDILCPQAVPAVATIDRDACLYFQNKCKICVPVCQAKAIDFTQKRKKGIIRVGAIVVNPGFAVTTAKHTGEYGYGRMKNVMHSMEFERILSASGPFGGHVLRLSDKKSPASIAWLQCVGSRDVRSGKTYCSAVCCTYGIKQMMVVKDHFPATKVAMFHNDIRTYGKGFEDLYNRCRKMDGVRFIRRRISEIRENPKTKGLRVKYISENGKPQIEEFDMVVLSVGMKPPESNLELSRVIGLDLNEHGFCRTDYLTPGELENKPGVYVAGAFTGPKDIPASVSSAGGAACLASRLLSGRRGTLVKKKVCPPERDVQGEDLKVGIFICHCGTNIAGVADIPALVQYASTLENVVHCEDQMISCSADSVRKMTETIIAKNLNRVVVAACTPKDHEPIFREALRDAGLNPYLLDMANIREHCTWVHSFDKEEATQKAKDIITMSVARARHLTALTDIELPMNKKGLVLGGGLAGMQSALSLAEQGFEVYLVEKENALGGHLNTIHYTLDNSDIGAFLEELKDRIKNERRITVLTGYALKSFAGFMGNFNSTFEKIDLQEDAPLILQHGITIVATGAKVAKPAEYFYGQSQRVIIQQELEAMIADGRLPRDLKQVAMIQCVGARNEQRPYCSHICCGEAVKNALKLKEIDEDLDVFVFYRDIRTYGFLEDYYALAREKGVIFIRYEPERKPQVRLAGEALSLTFHDLTVATDFEINPDLLVLSTPAVPEGNTETAQLLRLPLTGDGFFMEAHMKLRPVEFAADGIFLCGMAQYPKFIPDTIEQANAAALRAAAILSKDMAQVSGAICEVDDDKCIGCRLCEKACPYGAIKITDHGEKKSASVTVALCKGCGVCSSACAADAITIHHFTDKQIEAQIDAVYTVPAEKSKPRILGFLCNWCGYPGADLAGVSRIQYAPNIRSIRIMCSGRVHPKFIYRAFLKGVDGILVGGCHVEDCHYISGVQQMLKTLPSVRNKLGKMGIDPERFRLEFVSAAEGVKFAEVVNRFNDDMTRLGHLELTDEQRRELQTLESRKAKGKVKRGTVSEN